MEPAPLRFGDVAGKAAAAGFYRRSAARRKLVANVIYFYTRWINRAEWPTAGLPRASWPRSFRTLPQSVLDEAADALDKLKGGTIVGFDSRL